MKAVLRSVKPYWLYLIITGKKTLEVGKSCPQAKDWNKVVEMYCSKDMRSFNRIPEEDKEWMHKYLGKVACRFVCDCILAHKFHNGLISFNSIGLPSGTYSSYLIFEDDYKAMCLSFDEVKQYGKGKTIYGWHISQLKIYETPKELSEFYKVGAKSLEELDDELCRDCAPTKYGERRVHLVPNAGAAFCEGDYCEEAYRTYLEQEFALTRPPQSWMYVQELGERK